MFFNADNAIRATLFVLSGIFWHCAFAASAWAAAQPDLVAVLMGLRELEQNLWLGLVIIGVVLTLHYQGVQQDRERDKARQLEEKQRRALEKERKKQESLHLRKQEYYDGCQKETKHRMEVLEAFVLWTLDRGNTTAHHALWQWIKKNDRTLERLQGYLWCYYDNIRRKAYTREQEDKADRTWFVANYLNPNAQSFTHYGVNFYYQVIRAFYYDKKPSLELPSNHPEFKE